MLILLPPSEGKTAAARGRHLYLDRLGLPELGATRTSVLEAVGRTSLLEDAAERLGISPNLQGEIARNTNLLTAPTAAAGRVYSGVLHQALDLPSLDTASGRRHTAGSSSSPPSSVRCGWETGSRRTGSRRGSTSRPWVRSRRCGAAPSRRRFRARPGAARRRLQEQHVCRGLGAAGPARQAVGPGPRPGRVPSGQAHAGPRRTPPVRDGRRGPAARGAGRGGRAAVRRRAGSTGEGGAAVDPRRVRTVTA